MGRSLASHILTHKRLRLTLNRDSQFRQAFETNVFGVLKVTKALLPHFRERRMGTNVFISSLSGFHGYEFNAGYSGTKFALEGERPDALRNDT